jgi:lysyl-tRNA synthetase, class II
LKQKQNETMLLVALRRLHSSALLRFACASESPEIKSSAKQTSTAYTLERKRIAKTLASCYRRAQPNALKFVLENVQNDQNEEILSATRSSIESLCREYESQLAPGDRLVDCRVHIVGRVTSRRVASKKSAFFDLSSAHGRIQIMASKKAWIDATRIREHVGNDTIEDLQTSENDDRNDVGNSNDWLQFDEAHEYVRRGDIVSVLGFVAKSRVGELSVVPLSMQLLVPCLHDTPERIDDVDEQQARRYRYMRTAAGGCAMREALLCRAKMLATMRAFLDGRGFVEVETPVLSPHSGGASAQPFETRAREAFGGSDTPLFMRVAPELPLKHLIVGGMERVYEIGKQFRNEGADGTHNPEFTTLEFYQAYANVDQLQRSAVDLLRAVVDACAPFGGDGEQRQPIEWHAPFARINVMDALEAQLDPGVIALLVRYCIHAATANAQCELKQALLGACRQSGVDVTDPASASVASALDSLIDGIAKPDPLRPTFFVDLPLCLSPLAAAHPTRPGCADRFELYAGGFELINAYTELNDPDEQRRRFKQQQASRAEGDMDAHPHNELFCKALEYGMPPTAGFGLGVDRLLMLLLGRQSIHQVIAFPKG